MENRDKKMLSAKKDPFEMGHFTTDSANSTTFTQKLSFDVLASLASTVFPDFESFQVQLLDKINSKSRKWYSAALKDG